jgi:acyl-coenzyme A synthetase/AMP-(fatty) acid ligase
LEKWGFSRRLALTEENQLYRPAQEIIDASHVPDYDALRAEAAADPEGFWEERARKLDWYREWTEVLDPSDAPFFKWFVGAETNVVLNALDHHQTTATRNKLALIWEGEDGTLRTFSYFALNREVCQFATVLKSMGVRKGDRVTIYMPRIPELVMAMLACAKIGAVHSVVYGGFSVEALHERIEDSESRVLITADGGYLRGKIVPLKPGSGTKPFPGIRAEILDEDGKPVPPGEEGKLVITTPWPSMLRGIYRDPERYVEQYWSTYPGKYLTGDSAKLDEDGYLWIIGRMDDVIKVSGYRLGTAEIESALVSHPAVAEAAAIGIPHDVKGNVIHCHVILKAGHEGSQQLATELIQYVGSEVGPIAKPERVEFVDTLPKTRSGKITRRLLKARAMGLPDGDTSTLED